MEQNSTGVIVIVGMAVIALVIFLIIRNRKDQKTLNPDAHDSVEEEHMDQERRKDRV